jgi:putative oxidoreductase
MAQVLQGLLAVVGRLLLCAIFFLSAVGTKIPHFNDVAKIMESVGMPAPQLMLVGAIVFLLAGSVSVIVGYKARIGAVLLLTFLVLASYYFHAFWKLEGQKQVDEMIQFMKNLSMMGAMVFIIGNGAGPMSVDALLAKRSADAERPTLYAQAG